MIKTWTVRRFIEMNENGDLEIRPDFQRNPNWPKKAQCYFIDTILRGYPSPLIYLRPRIHPKTDRAVRDVVDGQQRLIAILMFSQNRLRLDSGTKEYEGLTFEELDPEDQERFLSYEVGVDELLNASDDYVIQVFHRLNAFGLRLTPQELRHGKYLGGDYKGVFRSAVIDASQRWYVLWESHRVVSARGRVRMANDELVAQMFGVLLDGVSDGGQPNINKLYDKYDAGIFKLLATSVGLAFAGESIRQIPDNMRYLPPPSYVSKTSPLSKRLSQESILTFVKS